MERIVNYFNKIKTFILNNKVTLLLSLVLVTLATSYVVIFYGNIFDTDSDYKEYSFVSNVVFSCLMFLGFLALFTTTYDKRRYKDINVSDIVKSGEFYLGTRNLFIGLAVFFFAIYALLTFDTISDMLSLLVSISIQLGMLYLLYQFINKFVSNNDDPTRFYKLKLFYHGFFLTVCYIVEKFVSIFTEVKNTPEFVKYVLLGEAILLSLYFGVPKLLEYLRPKDEIIIQKEPVYLTKQTLVGTYDNLNHKKGHKYNYAISFSVFIDENKVSSSSNTSKDTPILNYGKKPIITYNVKDRALRVSMLNGKSSVDTIYTTQNFPLQKWNNIVLNYSAGTLDVFINGNLVATSKNIVPYMSYDNIYIGAENGIRGGIKNVKYYTEPLSKLRIKLLNDLD